MPDHFETLGLPRRYAIDLPDLDRRFRELSREVHPDRFATAAPAERLSALTRSTALNDAYRVLKDPLRRAAYFLALNGLSIDAEGPEGRSQIQLPPAFLASFLELREGFEEGETSPEIREEMRERIVSERNGRADALVKELAAASDAAGAEGAPRDSLLPLAQQLLELRYYDRFLAELEEDQETDR